jgi:hypothetical protein
MPDDQITITLSAIMPPLQSKTTLTFGQSYRAVGVRDVL